LKYEFASQCPEGIYIEYTISIWSLQAVRPWSPSFPPPWPGPILHAHESFPGCRASVGGPRPGISVCHSWAGGGRCGVVPRGRRRRRVATNTRRSARQPSVSRRSLRPERSRGAATARPPRPSGVSRCPIAGHRRGRPAGRAALLLPLLHSRSTTRSSSQPRLRTPYRGATQRLSQHRRG
jgi:hypothetical protein